LNNSCCVDYNDDDYFGTGPDEKDSIDYDD